MKVMKAWIKMKIYGMKIMKGLSQIKVMFIKLIPSNSKHIKINSNERNENMKVMKEMIA
jgi:hypothetical protein